MSFQTTVRYDQALGVVGEIIKDGPLRAEPGVITSAAEGTIPAANVVIGRYFTRSSDGTWRPGGTGPAGGILARPKQYALLGTAAGGPLAASLLLPKGSVGEFVSMGFLIGSVATVAAVGDEVIYDTTTGALEVQAPGATPGAGKARVPGATVQFAPQTDAAGGVIAIRMTN